MQRNRVRIHTQILGIFRRKSHLPISVGVLVSKFDPNHYSLPPSDHSQLWNIQTNQGTGISEKVAQSNKYNHFSSQANQIAKGLKKHLDQVELHFYLIPGSCLAELYLELEKKPRGLWL